MNCQVDSVSASPNHNLSKVSRQEIELLEGLGVKGDAHLGKTVKHRSRVARDPSQPNLRQVHLMRKELLDELRLEGFAIAPGQMGENITTSGIDLMNLPYGTNLKIGNEVVVELTGFRSPCAQLDSIQTGLMKALLVHGSDNKYISKAGVMGIIIRGGLVRPNDKIEIQYPKGELIKLPKA